MVETALAISVFLLIVFGIINLSIFAYTTMSLQLALNQASRWGSLGYTSPGSNRVQSIEAQFQNIASGLSIDATDVTFQICPLNFPNCGGSNAGGSGQFVILSARKPAVELYGVGTLLASASVIIKNEPF